MASEHKGPLGGGLLGKDSAVFEVYLNLTPLMDVMSNILFFLLAAFGASAFAFVATTVPVQSDTETSIAIEEDKVTVTVRAEKQAGFTLQCESVTKTRDQLKAYGGKLPKVDSGFDYTGLTAALKKIKEHFPASNNMILVPDDDIPYDNVVRMMDASREFRLPDGRKIILFPEIVLSGIYKGK